MSPLRWDVLAVSFVLALPLLALGLRGDMDTQTVMMRLPWCLVAGWAAVAVLRWAAQPRGVRDAVDAQAEIAPDGEPSPTPRPRLLLRCCARSRGDAGPQRRVNHSKSRCPQIGGRCLPRQRFPARSDP